MSFIMRIVGEAMTDHQIGLAALVATIVGVLGTWLGVPQFQPEWWKRRDKGEPNMSLNLNGALPYQQSMPPGVARAAERTLAEITDALPEGSMVWLHEKDFGGSFRWGMIEFLEKFSWLPEVPAREFLDRDLESLRLGLVASAKEFLYLATRHTDYVFPATDSDIRKIPDQYDEQDNYSDKLFHLKQREINDAAEKVWDTYQKLVRRVRLKLAQCEIVGDKQ
jgi:hypothetical protein